MLALNKKRAYLIVLQTELSVGKGKNVDHSKKSNIFDQRSILANSENSWIFTTFEGNIVFCSSLICMLLDIGVKM
jgi:hypothetical protein